MKNPFLYPQIYPQTGRAVLTDIFANRYRGVEIFPFFENKNRRLLVQAYRIMSEQLFPISTGITNQDQYNSSKWESAHNKLSMELGQTALSPRFHNQIKLPIDTVCKNFLLADDIGTADEFMKERISFVELVFRERQEDINRQNAELPAKILDAKIRGARRGSPAGSKETLEEFLIRENKVLNQTFQSSVEELNIRFMQASLDLNYHNGFIQRSTDPLVEAEIETPFWGLVSSPLWVNVDTDMKEAIDKRDSNDRDPAFYAARALESTIKIISDQKGWTHAGEKGAHAYINNLSSQKNGRFISLWEAESLKGFFTHVRNPLGHGSGSAPMPALTPEQTNWAIEFCMIWIKNLILRF